MSEETWSDEELAQQIFSTLDSVSIVERVRAIAEADRTEDEVDELARNERHIQLKMAITQFVSGLSVDEKAKIDALKL
jgi:phosphoribosylcarboxyaminoimidazole (NCAIR) mutase